MDKFSSQTRLLKILPILGLGLMLLGYIILNLRGGIWILQLPESAQIFIFYLINGLFYILLGMIILPGLFLIYKIIKDKTFRNNIKQEKISMRWWIAVVMLVGIYLVFALLNITANSFEVSQAIETRMAKKYQELSSKMPEVQAQQELINWLKEEPEVFDAQLKNEGEYPGLKVWYTSGGQCSKAYLENSWYNLKRE